MATRATPTRLTSIVAIDERGAIGCKNALPWTLKSDMAFFKQQTLGNAVVMGRKTYESIGKCLPGRENIVLSHNRVLFAPTGDCAVAGSVDEVLYKISKSNKSQIFIVGGAQTYLQFAEFVDRYLVTFVKHAVDSADSFLDPSILRNFDIWGGTRLGSFGPKPGQDQFGFEIFEINPSNQDERLARRIERVESFKSRLPRPKMATKAQKPRIMATQDAFVF